MGSSMYIFMFIHLFLLLSCCPQSSSSKQPPLCRGEESSALLQFKQSFSINEYASGALSGYPKDIASWKLEGEEGDCCSWDGVKCDNDTNHVIGLDLSSSFLYGSINSSSSLFSLFHLQSLNLADNHFNYSRIPSEIGRLSSLTTLNLSTSVFTGQIPLEIPRLTKLASLDLSYNLLQLQPPCSLTTLAQNLTSLKELSLSRVNISSSVPDTLANLSSLTSLRLQDCGLRGEFPTGIFNLPKLQVLSVQMNPYLTGYLPEFHQSNSLKELWLANTSFSGIIPDSIGNLNSLIQLSLNRCKLSGSLPDSLANLTELTYLSLSYNNFTGGSMPRLGRLTKLTHLLLHDINLYGKIPSSLANLTQLTVIGLYSNHLSGQIPSWLMNLTKLTSIDLQDNQLQGPIPTSFSELKNLENVNLMFNNLSGTVEAGIFLNLKKLWELQLAGNHISFLTNTKTNASLPKFKYLDLGSCNLKEFPDFLRSQEELETLFLDKNQIQGQIPTWMLNVSKETLTTIWLSHNFLTGFNQLPVVLPWVNLDYLDLSYNMLQGSLPVPSPKTLVYKVSNNKLVGEIPPLICSMSSHYTLDLSNNNMSGTIPPCLGNFSNSLLVLNLKRNNFHGTIPHTHTKGNNLKMMDISQNQLEGKVPGSLANCTMLEILVLGQNQIEDTFPLWLGSLSELQVLVLRSNKFHGAIGTPTVDLEFPKLRIIDLSENGFTGDLPLEYFQNWNAMKSAHVDWLAYLQANVTFNVKNVTWDEKYAYSMTITNKGVKLSYEKILNIFTVVDLSSNKFKGEIPESIGNLKGLQLLNLSSNDLIGRIPPSIGNLTELGSLDLSQNKLSGEIPQQLLLLTFLAYLNVSNNHLSGPIPRGKQFYTFQNNSFEGNSALCGDPLFKICGNQEASKPPPNLTVEEDDDSEFPSGVDWIVIFMGFGSGIVVGFIIGKILTTRHHEWFVEKFGKRQGIRRRKRGRRN